MLNRVPKVVTTVLRSTVVVLVALVILTLIGSLTVHHSHTVNQINQWVDGHSLVLLAWQGLWIGIITYCYPTLVKKVLAKQTVAPSQLVRYTERRWIVLVFVLYETVLVHNLLAPVVNKILGF